MKTNIKHIISIFSFLSLFNLIMGQDKLIDIRTIGNVTECICRSCPEPNIGAKVKGRLVVPCKYYSIYKNDGYLFAYPSYHKYDYGKPADIYTQEGELIFRASYGFGIIEVKKEYNTYIFVDKAGKRYDKDGDICVKVAEYIGFTECICSSCPEPNHGAKINGRLVVPYKYHHVTFDRGVLFAYPSEKKGRDYYNYEPADVYTWNGELLFPASKGIVEYDVKLGITLFRDMDNNWYDRTGKFIVKTKYLSSLKLIVGSNGEIYVQTSKDGRYGISDNHGREILAPEFDSCSYLCDDLFAFKLNGYWGVIKKNGTIIIPLSRQYSSINYSRTLKMFTFVKQVDNVVYKGECDITGNQNTIQKDHVINQTTTTNTTTNGSQQPQRQLQPMQVWVQCPLCGGSGKCSTCGGLGWRFLTNSQPHAQCINCGGSGRCSGCAGQGGHYEIQYR